MTSSLVGSTFPCRVGRRVASMKTLGFRLVRAGLHQVRDMTQLLMQQLFGPCGEEVCSD